MASAAVVGADVARSPLPYKEVDDVMHSTTTVTSTQGAPKPLDRPSSDEDEDDDVVPTAKSRKSRGAMSALSDNDDTEMADVNDNDVENDLFGSGSEGDGEGRKPRKLDDSELDSGGDTDRDDRLAAEDGDQTEEQGAVEDLDQMEAAIGPHPVPEPTDGELYLLKVPKFLAFEPRAFEPETFKPPETDLHSKTEASSNFSAFKAAMKTLRWRKGLQDPSNTQSNARILRWSDGSLTLQMANEPTTQYMVPGHPLTTPQHKPPKPTPTSTGEGRRKQQHSQKSTDQESYTYLLAPSNNTGLLRVTNKITTSLQVELSGAAPDDAVARLRTRIDTDKTGGRNGESGGIKMVEYTEDPELKRKKAEVVEKQLAKNKRKEEMAELRDRERSSRVLGRRGLGGMRSGGGLDDDDELGAGTRKGVSGARRSRPKRQRRGEILSDEEENWGKRGRTREDEYDEEDDFVATSDEEEEPEGGDDEDEEDIDEGIDLVKQGLDKGQAASEDQGAQRKEDTGTSVASTKVDTTQKEGSPIARSKRRRVIEDDDEE